jgi:hypothetical protein
MIISRSVHDGGDLLQSDREGGSDEGDDQRHLQRCRHFTGHGDLATLAKFLASLWCGLFGPVLEAVLFFRHDTSCLAKDLSA